MSQDDFPDFEDFNFDESDLFASEEDEPPEIEEEPAEGGQRNRAFLIGVAVLAGIFVVALIVVVLLIAGRPSGPSPNDLTNTVIVQRGTETAQADALTMTAESWTDTPTATFTPSDTPTPEPTATETPIPSETPTGTPTEPPTLMPTAEPPTPTEEVVSGESLSEGEPLASGTGGPLPGTGFADHLGLGSGLMLAGVAAVGLLSVVFLARRMRSRR